MGFGAAKKLFSVSLCCLNSFSFYSFEIVLGAGAMGSHFAAEKQKQQRDLYLKVADRNDETARSYNVIVKSGEQVPMAIALAEEDSDYRFLRIEDLPDDFALTAGLRSKSSWLVSRAEIEQLNITPPEGYSGKFVFRISFFHEAGTPPFRSAVMNVWVQSKDGPANQSQNNKNKDFIVDKVNVATPPQPLPPPENQLSPREQANLLERGDNFWQNGDIVSARLIYEEVAHMGNARGALAMAQSYDPSFLKELNLTESVQPDLDKARMWYEKANALGNQDALQQLRKLSESR